MRETTGSNRQTQSKLSSMPARMRVLAFLSLSLVDLLFLLGGKLTRYTVGYQTEKGKEHVGR